MTAARLGAAGRDRAVVEQPRCHKCQHYFITWDPERPHGCRMMGFKSSKLPSQVVFRSSGSRCLVFCPKPLPRQESKE